MTAMAAPIDGRKIRVDDARLGWAGRVAIFGVLQATSPYSGHLQHIPNGQVESVITRRSAEQLSLKKGDKVKVVIKCTEVMLQKE